MFKVSTLNITSAVLALGAIAAGCTATASSTVVAKPDTECRVDLDRVGNMVEITAMIETRTNAHGTYSLDISKSGRSGSANIKQGGYFDLRAGETKTWRAVKMTGSHRDFDATMVLDIDGTEISCITSRPLD